ncbi:hypothetical protein SynA1825c_02828 [Synechococcus sp. A18-25c]|nr:hypothetical protein SynA1560_02866 [Synechococcus sp. A15-60]QNJ21103.1 hypothetical protein SynA1825c_02828 [Synechococcus sp. A18-25c]
MVWSMRMIWTYRCYQHGASSLLMLNQKGTVGIGADRHSARRQGDS